MKPNPEFSSLPKHFWANIRVISQSVGYTAKVRRIRGGPKPSSSIKIPTSTEISECLAKLGHGTTHLIGRRGRPTALGKQALNYFEYRASILNGTVEPLLMDASAAEQCFHDLRTRLRSTSAVPMNKQSNEKKKPAYFTGMVNMLLEANLGGLPCDYNPRELTIVTRNGQPFRTMARRVDGAFPSPVDPLAIWEIKEYYYTTSFGSRVADGVYETLLDGMELAELDAALAPRARVRTVQHLLMVDAYFTWWVQGRSYLCRLIDMLHMGYVGEVLFGREILTRLPVLAQEWAQLYRAGKSARS